MAELVYARVSTDEQSTQRQTDLLTEAGLLDGADGVRLFADAATSRRSPHSSARASASWPGTRAPEGPLVPGR